MTQMTSKERMNALLNGDDYDRAPVLAFHPGYSAKIAGLSVREAFNTPEKLADKEVAFYERFGLDAVDVSYTSVNFGIRNGSRIKTPDMDTPSIDVPVLEDFGQLDRLDPERLTFRRDVAQRVNYNGLIEIYERIGHEINPTFAFDAPFTMASGVISAELMLRATRKNKEELHQLLRFVTDFTIRMLDKLMELDFLNFFIYDPVASGSLLSPKQYKEFCLPYTKEIVDFIKKHDRYVGLHICGNTTRSLDIIADTGVDIFSLDQEVDIKEASDIIGHRLVLMGNVDPITTLLQGDETSLEEEIKTCFQGAKNNPKGYIMATGCAIPMQTPTSQMDAFVKFCHQYGARS